MFTFQTERLILRELIPGDAKNMYQLNLDPEVTRYTGDGAFSSVDEARQFLENYDHYKKYGFGRWAMIGKHNGEFIGWCGLKYTPAVDEYDIGFRLFKKFWGLGFATEAATACLEIGFQKFNLQTIVGRAMTDNRASVHVLQKIGLTFIKESEFDLHDGVLFAIERPLPII